MHERKNVPRNCLGTSVWHSPPLLELLLLFTCKSVARHRSRCQVICGLRKVHNHAHLIVDTSWISGSDTDANHKPSYKNNRACRLQSSMDNQVLLL